MNNSHLRRLGYTIWIVINFYRWRFRVSQIFGLWRGPYPESKIHIGPVHILVVRYYERKNP